MSTNCNIGILFYPQFTLLDVTGPFEVFSRIPHASVFLIGKNLEPCVSDTGMEIRPTHTFEETPPLDVLCVSGGPGQIDQMRDEATVSFIRERARQAKIISAVCTGTFLLGAAGLLEGRRATTHWSAVDQLEHFGALAIDQRVVVDDPVVTCAGVSAGIDLALTVADRLGGETLAQGIALGIEYDPQPPTDAGSAARAPEAIKDYLLEYADHWQRRREMNESFRG